jgi:hypothetical protein
MDKTNDYDYVEGTDFHVLTGRGKETIGIVYDSKIDIKPGQKGFLLNNRLVIFEEQIENRKAKGNYKSNMMYAKWHVSTRKIHKIM